MAKKSRKAAARYSELSKGGRKKQRVKNSSQPAAAVAPTPAEPPESTKIDAVTDKKTVTTGVAIKPQAVQKQYLPDYQYVRGDLRMIGILAGTVVVILIVLTFVLG